MPNGMPPLTHVVTWFCRYGGILDDCASTSAEIPTECAATMDYHANLFLLPGGASNADAQRGWHDLASEQHNWRSDSVVDATLTWAGAWDVQPSGSDCGALILIGGMTSEKEAVDTVHQSTDGGISWSKLTPKHGSDEFTGRYAHAAVWFNDKVMVTGGRDDQLGPLHDVFLFDPTQRLWTLLTEFTEATSPDGEFTASPDPHPLWHQRYGHAMVVYDGGVLLFGGRVTGGVTHDVYRTETGADWRLLTIAAPWEKRSHFGASEFAGHVWLAGGLSAVNDFGEEHALSDVWATDDGISWVRVATSTCIGSISGMSLARIPFVDRESSVVALRRPGGRISEADVAGERLLLLGGSNTGSNDNVTSWVSAPELLCAARGQFCFGHGVCHFPGSEFDVIGCACNDATDTSFLCAWSRDNDDAATSEADDVTSDDGENAAIQDDDGTVHNDNDGGDDDRSNRLNDDAGDDDRSHRLNDDGGGWSRSSNGQQNVPGDSPDTVMTDGSAGVAVAVGIGVVAAAVAVGFLVFFMRGGTLAEAKRRLSSAVGGSDRSGLAYPEGEYHHSVNPAEAARVRVRRTTGTGSISGPGQPTGGGAGGTTQEPADVHPVEVNRLLPSLKADTWFIPFHELTLQTKIGAGGAGQVWKGTYAGSTVALKQLYSNMMDPEDLADFRAEASLLSQLRHPQIVTFFGVSAHESELYIVSEYCAYSVEDWLRDARRRKAIASDYCLERVVALADEIAQGIVYLHSRGVVHRDIKPENLLLTEPGPGGHIRIIDLGIARVVHEGKSMTVNRGTPAFMAPETTDAEMKGTDADAAASTKNPLANGPMKAPEGVYTTAVDVYSFGIVLWTMVHREMPFGDVTNIFAIPMHVASGKRPPIDPSTPARLADLMRSCWQSEPAKRPTMEAVLRELRSPDILSADAPRPPRRGGGKKGK